MEPPLFLLSSHSVYWTDAHFLLLFPKRFSRILCLCIFIYKHLSKSLLTPDLLPSTEVEALPAGHLILETDEVALYELDRMVIAGDETGEIFTADLQVTNIGVNQQQFLHFMPDGVPRFSPHPSLQPFSDRGSPENFNESWSKLLVTHFER